ncbi:hypothetical protein D9M73_75850 [compost metagenome]
MQARAPADASTRKKPLACTYTWAGKINNKHKLNMRSKPVSVPSSSPSLRLASLLAARSLR